MWAATPAWDDLSPACVPFLLSSIQKVPGSRLMREPGILFHSACVGSALIQDDGVDRLNEVHHGAARHQGDRLAVYHG